MPLFKKKNSKQPEVDRTQERINELKAFKDIGEKFNYMGVTIICTGHFEIDYYGITTITRPALKGDYKNDKGEIKSILFSYGELPALKAENLQTEGSLNE